MQPCSCGYVNCSDNEYCGKCGRPFIEKKTRYYCRQCACERKQAVCQKCGGECFTPSIDWEEPRLPDIEKIRALAKEIGYAIGVHGTLERDLDVIAAPWTEEALKYNWREVMDHIAKGMNGRVVEASWKPLGRRACTILIDGWYKDIDLSVCPILIQKGTQEDETSGGVSQ